MADEKKMRTRCYYTDYVNHMIRFFLSTPDKLDMEGKRKADLDNWLAVQAVWYKLPEENKQVLKSIFGLHHRVSEGVRMYCEQTGADEYKTWVFITKTCAAIAKRRGLV